MRVSFDGMNEFQVEAAKLEVLKRMEANLAEESVLARERCRQVGLSDAEAEDVIALWMQSVQRQIDQLRTLFEAPTEELPN